MTVYFRWARRVNFGGAPSNCLSLPAPTGEASGFKGVGEWMRAERSATAVGEIIDGRKEERREEKELWMSFFHPTFHPWLRLCVVETVVE